MREKMTGENDNDIKGVRTINNMKSMREIIRNNNKRLSESRIREFNLERWHKHKYEQITERDTSRNAYIVDDETGAYNSIICYNAQPQSSAIDPESFGSRDLLPTYDNDVGERMPGKNDTIGNEFDDMAILNHLIRKRKLEDKKYANAKK